MHSARRCVAIIRYCEDNSSIASNATRYYIATSLCVRTHQHCVGDCSTSILDTPGLSYLAPLPLSLSYFALSRLAP